MMRFVQWVAWAVLVVCVNAAARRLFWPGHLPSGVTAWAFNGGCFLVAALLIRLAQGRHRQAAEKQG